MSIPFIKRTLRPYIPKEHVGVYVFGATNVEARSWGFPGTTLNKGQLRPKSSTDWIPVYGQDDSPGLPKIFNDSKQARFKTSDSTWTYPEKSITVLRTATASQLNITRSTGAFKLFKIPEIQNPEFWWRLPSSYLRTEIHVKAFPTVARFRGEGSGIIVTETVNGYSTYTSTTMIPNLSKYWSRNGVTLYNLKQIATGRTLKKIRDNEVELSVALAESRKTIDHLAKTAHSMFQLYRAVKRGNFKEAWRVIQTPDHGVSRSKSRKKFFSTKDPAQRWLEVQYAWGPLLGDINGAINLVLTEKKFNISMKATGSVREDFTADESRNLSSRDPEIHVVSGYRVVKTIVHYAVTDPAKVFMGQAGINPLLAVWEVVPWSFVIDWFLTIGDALESLDANIGKEFISGTTTEFVKGSCLSYMPVFPVQTLPFGHVRTNSGLSRCETEFLSMKRTALTTWPKVGPRFKNPFSTIHVLNAIALARSLRKR